MVYRSNVIPRNQEINDAHASAVEDFRRKHGRFPNSKDPEFWEMSEVYKSSYQRIIDEFNVFAIKERREEEKKTENPVFSKRKIVSERICAVSDCEELIQPTGKRGRPPTKCEKHRVKKDAPPKNARIIEA